jgi:hypothetical protein
LEEKVEKTPVIIRQFSSIITSRNFWSSSLKAKALKKIMRFIKKTDRERSSYRARLTRLAKTKLSNPTEDCFQKLCLLKDLRAIHEGWPDFSVWDAAGNFKGFTEIKPDRREKLRFSQTLFRRICKLFNIPYLVWTKEQDIPPEFFR